MLPTIHPTSTWCLLQEASLSVLLENIFIRWTYAVDKINGTNASIQEFTIDYFDIMNTIQQIMNLYNTAIDLCVQVITNRGELIICLNSLIKGLETLAKVYGSIYSECNNIRRSYLLQIRQDSTTTTSTVPQNTNNTPPNSNLFIDWCNGVSRIMFQIFQLTP